MTFVRRALFAGALAAYIAACAWIGLRWAHVDLVACGVVAALGFATLALALWAEGR